jgi:hypothetical protein
LSAARTAGNAATGTRGVGDASLLASLCRPIPTSPFSLHLPLPSHFASCTSVELGEGHSISDSLTPYTKATKRKAQTIHPFLRGGGLEPGSSIQDAGSFSLPQRRIALPSCSGSSWGLARNPTPTHSMANTNPDRFVQLRTISRIPFPHHESHGVVFKRPSPMGRDRHPKFAQARGASEMERCGAENGIAGRSRGVSVSRIDQ